MSSSSSPCSIEVRRPVRIQEGKERPIYCIAWSKDKRRLANKQLSAPFFAAVGGRFLSLYSNDEQEQDEGNVETIQLFQSYRDNDVKEDFYACVFAGRSAVNAILPEKTLASDDNGNVEHVDDNSAATPNASDDDDDDDVDNNNNHDTNDDASKHALHAHLVFKTPSTRQRGAFHHWPLADVTGDGAQLLCVAGKSGVIKVLDPVQCQFISFLLGHGDEIYDLKVAPNDENLLLSASKDRSCRVWNLKTGGCIAILKGTVYAHKDAIVSIAWQPKAQMIATASLDTTVKLWKTSTGVPLRETIRQSHVDAEAYKEKRLQRVVDPLVVAIPDFSSTTLHMQGVDWCVSCFVLCNDADLWC